MTGSTTQTEAPVELSAEEVASVSGGNSGLIWSGGG
jgi:hypothetical protein